MAMAHAMMRTTAVTMRAVRRSSVVAVAVWVLVISLCLLSASVLIGGDYHSGNQCQEEKSEWLKIFEGKAKPISLHPDIRCGNLLRHGGPRQLHPQGDPGRALVPLPLEG